MKCYKALLLKSPGEHSSWLLAVPSIPWLVAASIQSLPLVLPDLLPVPKFHKDVRFLIAFGHSSVVS